ncbi:cytochrome c oxidase assembly factor CtaG [Paenibacillus sp. GCM10027629]|uniref:cytochrome c oxidase assembly factor CtaG n=1 Tax=Paenibacillus sp. GCM10027629 TaxID=3273414 RepID=UPI00362A26ED
MLGLEYFSFSDLWSPWFLMLMIVITSAYFVVIGPLRTRFAEEGTTRLGQKICFVTGMVLFYLAQGGPISFLSHLMFTFHMLAMALSYIIVPPLIILGIPTWLWRSVFRYRPLHKLKFLMHPIFTAVLFNALFSLYHVPAVHDYVMLHFVVHRIYYVVLLITSMMMWWPILSPIPGGKLQDVSKMAYIFVNSVLITPACALIIFAGEPMYATYNDPNVWAQAMGYCFSGDPKVLLDLFDGPTFFNILDPMQDQQVGGIMMKFIQELVNGSALAYIFYHWVRRESRDDDMDELPIMGSENWNKA